MPVACSAPSTPGRHSSGVERTLGKGEVESSILSGGTIFPQFSVLNFVRAAGGICISTDRRRYSDGLSLCGKRQEN